MARLAMVLPLAALAMMWLPTLFVTPPLAGHMQHERFAKPSALAAQTAGLEAANSHPVAAVLAAAVIGVLAGLVTGPKMAMAASGADPLMRRPDYMQGIDAANAATRPGQIDYITRQRIEALQFPQSMEEAKAANELVKKAPTQEQRVQRQKAVLEELSKTTELPA